MNGLSGACPMTSPVSAIIQYVSGRLVLSRGSHATVMFQIPSRHGEAPGELGEARLAGCESIITDLVHRTTRRSPMFTANHVLAIKKLEHVQTRDRGGRFDQNLLTEAQQRSGTRHLERTTNVCL